MHTLYLRVKNIHNLAKQCSATHCFTQKGGSLGSGEDNAWVIDDTKNQIHHIQALIHYEDEAFGIKPYTKECQIFLNDSFSAICEAYEIAIKAGDCLRMGDLEIEVLDEEGFHLQNQEDFQSLGDLGELQPYQTLDEDQLKPKGFEGNFDPLKAEELDLFGENDNILGLDEENPSLNLQTHHLVDYLVSPTNVKTMLLHKSEQLLSQLQSKTQPQLHLNTTPLRMLDLEARIQHFSLVENKEILNLLVLSLLTESLHQPVLQSLYPQCFERGLSEMIEKAIKGETDLIELALLEILKERHQLK